MKKLAFLPVFIITSFVMVSCEQEKALNACNSYNAIEELP
jgi:hypothetical protein